MILQALTASGPDQQSHDKLKSLLQKSLNKDGLFFFETLLRLRRPDVRNGCALPQAPNVEWAMPSPGARTIWPRSEGAAQSEVQPDGKAQPFLTSGGEAGANVSWDSGDLF